MRMGMGWGWEGTGWDEMGMGWDGTGWNGMGWWLPCGPFPPLHPTGPPARGEPAAPRPGELRHQRAAGPSSPSRSSRQPMNATVGKRSWMPLYKSSTLFIDGVLTFLASAWEFISSFLSCSNNSPRSLWGGQRGTSAPWSGTLAPWQGRGTSSPPWLGARRQGCPQDPVLQHCLFPHATPTS